MHVAFDEAGMDRCSLRVDDPICPESQCDRRGVPQCDNAAAVDGNRPIFNDAAGVIHGDDIAVADDEIDALWQSILHFSTFAYVTGPP